MSQTNSMAKPSLCTQCKAKPARAGCAPFCSKRCADLDLGKWLNGSYAIPAVEPPDSWSERGTTGLDDEAHGEVDRDTQWRH